MFHPFLNFEFPVSTCARGNAEQQRRDASEWAKGWLHLKSHCTSKPAAVFDIDATLVNRTEVLPSIVDLFYFCQKNYITCFLITARPEVGRYETEELLKKLGIQGYRNAYFMRYDHNTHITSSYVASSKLQWRDKIQARGYTIILNAGDAWTDHDQPSKNRNMREQFSQDATLVFITPDGVLHLKLPEVLQQ